VVGVVYFFLYYFVFRFVIRRFNVPTPGREADDDPPPEVTAAETSSQPGVSL
jgi:PTS system N-acetylglucosamine-specific IIC component